MNDKLEKEKALLNRLIKTGSLGILATGYRGIMLWKENREFIKPSKKSNEEKKS
jgi:hypothetical protein